MRFRVMAWILLLSPTLVAAQQSSTPKAGAPPAKQSSTKSVAKAPTSDSAKIADIRRLLELTGTKDMVNQMKSVMMSQFRQNAPGMPPGMFDEMMAELKAEDLEESMIPVYANHFTGDDIKHLIAFYESPFGRKVMREMPQIITEANEVGVHWGQGVVTRVAGRWRDQGKITQRAYDQLVNAAGPEEEH
jgi:uncharacterized protein